MYDTRSGASAGDFPATTTATDGATPEPMPTVVPEPMPAPTECVQPSGSLPTDDSALALTKEKFSALGFDPTSANWTVVDGGGMWGYSSELSSAFKLVTAKVLVDGFDSKQSWSMVVGPDGAIVSANGFFAKLVPTAAYEIVGAKSAIERSQSGLWMNLPPQEVQRDNMVYPMPLGTNQAVETQVKRNSSGQPILDGGLDRVTIASAEKTLISWYLNDGSTILLPAYLLSESSADDSRQWLQLSIADKYVDFS
jgi:hypothetical protein